MSGEDYAWKKFPAKDSAYEDIRDFIITAAVRAGVGKKRILKLELGFEEAVVNVISYAYDGNDGDIFIKVTDDIDGKNFILELADYGKPFNPLEKNDPRAEDKSQIEERQIGGLGISFMKKTFAALDYSNKLFRGKEANCLKLVFKKD